MKSKRILTLALAAIMTFSSVVATSLVAYAEDIITSNYQKVNAVSEIVTGDYVFYGSNPTSGVSGAMGNEKIDNFTWGSLNINTVDATSGTIATADAAIVWTVTVLENGNITIQNKATKQYLQVTQNNLKAFKLADEATEYGEFELSIGATNDDIRITSIVDDFELNPRYISLVHETTKDYFGTVDPSGQEGTLHLYKLTAPVTEYTVIIIPDNGTEPTSVKVMGGQVLAQPETLVKTGYKFVKWLDENGIEFSFSTPIKSDITLTAIWEKVPTPDNYYKVNEVSQILTDDYVFYGSNPTSGVSGAMGNEKIDNFTWGSLNINTVDATSGTIATADAAIVWTVTVLENGNVTIQNKATKQYLQVTQNNLKAFKLADEATEHGEFKLSVGATNDDIRITSIVDDFELNPRYISLVHETTKDYFGTVDPSGQEGTLHLYKLTAPVTEYTVTIIPDNGTEPTSVKVMDGQVLAQPETPVKTGYKFVKWVDANGGEFNFSTPIAGDITLTAIWEKAPVITPNIPSDTTPTTTPTIAPTTTVATSPVTGETVPVVAWIVLCLSMMSIICLLKPKKTK